MVYHVIVEFRDSEAERKPCDIHDRFTVIGTAYERRKRRTGREARQQPAQGCSEKSRKALRGYATARPRFLWVIVGL